MTSVKTTYQSGKASRTTTRTGNVSSTCLDGQKRSFSRGGEAFNKICGHKKEKQMKFPVHSSRPALVYACALSLFPTLAWAQHYQQQNLVSNVPVTPAASVTDPNLQNAWGLVHGPTTPWWISNNGRRHFYALRQSG